MPLAGATLPNRTIHQGEYDPKAMRTQVKGYVRIILRRAPAAKVHRRRRADGLPFGRHTCRTPTGSASPQIKHGPHIDRPMTALVTRTTWPERILSASNPPGEGR